MLSKCIAIAISLLLSGPANYASAAGRSETAPAAVPPGTSPQTVATFNNAVRCLNQGQLDEAIRLGQSVCGEAPTFADAHMVVGSAMLKAGNPTEAVNELSLADRLSPDHPGILINLGGAYQLLGDYPHAVAKLQRYIELYPKGQYMTTVNALLSALRTEEARDGGIKTTRGTDNYLSEAISIGAARWNIQHIPVPIFIKPATDVVGYRESYDGILRTALDEWAAGSEGRIKFKFVTDPKEGLIICQWTGNPKDVINPTEGGQALVSPNTNGEIENVQIKLLTRLSQANIPNIEACVHVICLHEIGHSMGLLGHSSQPGDVMFSTLNEFSPVASLSNRDKKTIQALYDADPAMLKAHQLQLGKAAFSENDTPLNRAIRLNNEALTDIEAKRYQQAIAKLKQELQLQPDLKIASSNLAVVYTQLGNDAFRAKDFPNVFKYLKEAVSCYAHVQDYEQAGKVLTFLASVARRDGKDTEAKAYESQAQEMASKY